VGLHLNSDLVFRTGKHKGHLHGRDSNLTMELESLGALRHLRQRIPRPLPVGTSRSRLLEPIRILVKVKGILVATVIYREHGLLIRRHWLGIVRCLLT